MILRPDTRLVMLGTPGLAVAVRPIVAAGGGVLSSAAITALVSWWALDEESGTRYDSHGSNDLAEPATAIGYVAGKQGNAADFVSADNVSLSVASNAGLQINTVDFSVVGWFDRDNTSNNCLISKWPDSKYEWAIHYELDGGGPQFGIGNGSTSYEYVQYGGSALGAQWYFVAAWHNASTKTLYIQIDNGTVYSDTYDLTPGVNTGDVTLGRTASRHAYDGALDEWAIFKGYILTADERAALYNSGNGVTYATAVGA